MDRGPGRPGDGRGDGPAGAEDRAGHGEVRQDIVLFPSCAVEFRIAPETDIGSVDLSFASLDGERVCPEIGSSSLCTVRVTKDRGSLAMFPETWISVRAEPAGGPAYAFELDLTSPPDEPVMLRPERARR